MVEKCSKRYWLAGVVGEPVLVAVVYCALPAMCVPVLAPAAGTSIVLAGAPAGLTGWPATRALVSVTQWSQAS